MPFPLGFIPPHVIPPFPFAPAPPSIQDPPSALKNLIPPETRPYSTQDLADWIADRVKEEWRNFQDWMNCRMGWGTCPDRGGTWEIIWRDAFIQRGTISGWYDPSTAQFQLDGAFNSYELFFYGDRHTGKAAKSGMWWFNRVGTAPDPGYSLRDPFNIYVYVNGKVVAILAGRGCKIDRFRRISPNKDNLNPPLPDIPSLIDPPPPLKPRYELDPSFTPFPELPAGLQIEPSPGPNVVPPKDAPKIPLKGFVPPGVSPDGTPPLPRTEPPSRPEEIPPPGPAPKENPRPPDRERKVLPLPPVWAPAPFSPPAPFFSPFPGPGESPRPTPYPRPNPPREPNPGPNINPSPAPNTIPSPDPLLSPRPNPLPDPRPNPVPDIQPPIIPFPAPIPNPNPSPDPKDIPQNFVPPVLFRPPPLPPDNPENPNEPKSPPDETTDPPPDLERNLVPPPEQECYPVSCFKQLDDNLGENAKKLKDLEEKLDKLKDLGDTAMLGEILDRLGPKIPGGGLSSFIQKAWKSTHLDKVINLLTLVAALHNAAMLSRNVIDTLSMLIDNVLNIFHLKTEKDEPLNIGEVLGDSIENALKAVIGADIYNQVSLEWKKASAIYQSATNIYSYLTDSVYSMTEAMQTIGNYTGKIGNALKRGGVVIENAYQWMDESLNLHTGKRNAISGVIDGLNSAENIVSDLEDATSEVREMQENIQEIKDEKNRIKGLISQKEDDKKSEEDTKKTASQSPVVADADLTRDEPPEGS